MPEADKQTLEQLTKTPVVPGFTHVIHSFAHGFFRHPNAGLCIGHTIYEADRIPPSWVPFCNSMDYLLVSTEFNLQTFEKSGVLPEKLIVVPQCLDMAPYDAERGAPVPGDAAKSVRKVAALPGYKILAVFDWTMHKGGDVLIKTFDAVCGGRDDVHLILKIWSSMGYNDADLQAKVAEYLPESRSSARSTLDRIHVIHERVSDRDMRALLRAVDC